MTDSREPGVVIPNWADTGLEVIIESGKKRVNGARHRVAELHYLAHECSDKKTEISEDELAAIATALRTQEQLAPLVALKEAYRIFDAKMYDRVVRLSSWVSND
ncbi:hypothetical protein [Mycobacterium sp. 94-17]|uniref:hypothetical protein n=1 Tax=Mycobacterium sp. 94-17 TaxID=2986147 RepID=UPI002D1E4C5C|nr:hypothetical protein [Mycobacterium sp. 94-17]MEB4212332.1 hypothetical protein [Mycobacterium sp. 94-17]